MGATTSNKKIYVTKESSDQDLSQNIMIFFLKKMLTNQQPWGVFKVSLAILSAGPEETAKGKN